jgi:hypothetical protein
LARRSSWVTRSETLRNWRGRDFRTMRELVVLAGLALAVLVVLRPFAGLALRALALLASLPVLESRAIFTLAPVPPYRARPSFRKAELVWIAVSGCRLMSPLGPICDIDKSSGPSAVSVLTWSRPRSFQAVLMAGAAVQCLAATRERWRSE